MLRRLIDHWITKSSKFRNEHLRRASAEWRLQDQVLELAELRERIPEISRRLCQVTVISPPYPFPHIHISLDIDPRVVEQGFKCGGNNTILDGIGDDLGRRAVKALRSTNFFRWNPNQ